MKKALTLLFILIAYAAQAQETGLTVQKYGKNCIRIFPNPSCNGSFEISSTEKTSLSLYVFDLAGTLVYQAQLKGKDRHIIQNLNKGTYIYDVFKNDEGIEHGRLIVK